MAINKWIGIANGIGFKPSELEGVISPDFDAILLEDGTPILLEEDSEPLLLEK